MSKVRIKTLYITASKQLQKLKKMLEDLKERLEDDLKDLKEKGLKMKII